MGTRDKPVWPFMVFAESLPQAAKLADPNTLPAERDAIRREVNALVEAVKTVSNRNTQTGRHEANHERRNRVMADFVPGKRGEPKRLASLHGVSRRTVEKWTEQLRKACPKGSEDVPNDWRTVYYGQALRNQRSVAARQSKKRKG